MNINNERKERILAYICSEEYIPLKADELMIVLDVPHEAHQELMNILDELCREGKIHITKKGRYMSVDKNSQTASGTVVCSAKSGFAFVKCEGGDVYVSASDLGLAIHGDKVLLRIDKEKNAHSSREGHVIEVLERPTKTLAGVVSALVNGVYKISPDNKRIYHSIRVYPDDMMGAKKGQRVAVELTSQNDRGKLYGKVISVLGEAESLKGCIEGIIIEHNIKTEFEPETLEEAQQMPDKVTDTGNRRDLRDKLIFTIDGDDARDFDDAVSLEIKENGNYLLGVHIADVTHYVKEGSSLDREAHLRGTSVYLADRVIPMLPETLSNGICSLNPNVDRLTLSVFMEIDKNGGVVGHTLEETVIKSKERMTYNKATAMLEGDAEYLKEYAHIADTLTNMQELAYILNKKRAKRGAINFDFPESGIVVDEDGEPVEIIKEERGISNKIIEEFMLIANETVAEYAFWSELPFVYRVHEAPSEDKLTAFNNFIRNFGISIKGRIDKDEAIHPKALQAVLDSVKDTPEERMVSSMMLHSLMKADYRPQNDGHFGLAAKYYCHFTSPIRRYPDLMIHRVLKCFINGKMGESERGRFINAVKKASEQSSKTEIEAEYTERDVDELMKTRYMSAFVGECFEGIVANVTNFGMFVELENSVEGLVRLETMNDDYYEYDEEQNTLTGKRKGRVYRIGDNVNVVLAHTDLMLRQIDFVREEDATTKVLAGFSRTKKTVRKETAKKDRRRFIKRRGRKKHGKI